MPNRFNDLSLLESSPLLPVYKDLYNAMNNHDAEAFTELFLETGTVIFSNDMHLIGKKMILKAIKDIYEVHNNARYASKIKSVQQISPDTKLLISDVVASSKIANEMQTYFFTTQQVILFVLSEGYWKIGMLCNTETNTEKDIVASTQKKIDLGLSEKEQEIFDLLVQGYSNSEIAEKCDMKIRTVSTHRSNILKKTGYPNIAALILKTIQ